MRIQPEKWVPQPIVEFVNVRLYGDEIEPVGWHDILQMRETELSKTEGLLRSLSLGDDRTSKDNLRRDAASIRMWVKDLRRQIANLERLISDNRMQEAYDYLRPEFTQEMQWKGFAAAAWGADIDFQVYRKRVKDTKEHSQKIAQAAEELADLLEASFGIPWPSEFASVKELLRRTDNHEMNDHNFYMWANMRQYILGEWESRANKSLPKSGAVDAEPETASPTIEIRSAEFTGDEDREERLRNEINYVWGVSPPLSALLRVLAKEARSFIPSQYGAIAEAISKRQHNAKTEYIRAFAHILRDRNIALTDRVRKALAVAATVMLNDEDIVISDEDVRKTLG